MTLACAHRVWRPIIELADERDARALIVGSHGASGVRSALLGSVAHSIVGHARCPVVVVPSGPNASEDPSSSCAGS